MKKSRNQIRKKCGVSRQIHREEYSLPCDALLAVLDPGVRAVRRILAELHPLLAQTAKHTVWLHLFEQDVRAQHRLALLRVSAARLVRGREVARVQVLEVRGRQLRKQRWRRDSPAWPPRSIHVGERERVELPARRHWRRRLYGCSRWRAERRACRVRRPDASPLPARCLGRGRTPKARQRRLGLAWRGRCAAQSARRGDAAGAVVVVVAAAAAACGVCGTGLRGCLPHCRLEMRVASPRLFQETLTPGQTLFCPSSDGLYIIHIRVHGIHPTREGKDKNAICVSMI